MDLNRDDKEFEKLLKLQTPVVPLMEERERNDLLRRVRLESPSSSNKPRWKLLGWSMSAAAAVFAFFISIDSLQTENNKDIEEIYSLLSESDFESNLMEENSEYALFLDSSDESLIYE